MCMAIWRKPRPPRSVRERDESRPMGSPSRRHSYIGKMPVDATQSRAQPPNVTPVAHLNAHKATSNAVINAKTRLIETRRKTSSREISYLTMAKEDTLGEVDIHYSAAGLGLRGRGP